MLTFPERGEDLHASLSAVHQWALDRFDYVRDEVRWKGDPITDVTHEHWEADAELLADLHGDGVVHGDCDAFAKLCWFLLRRLFIASHLVVCTTETGEGHAVCEASGFILDNRQMRIVAREELERIGYHWHSMSKPYPSKTEMWNLVT